MKTTCPACQCSLNGKISIDVDTDKGIFKILDIKLAPCKESKNEDGTLKNLFKELNAIFQKHNRQYASATQWRKHIMADLLKWKDKPEVSHIMADPLPVPEDKPKMSAQVHDICTAAKVSKEAFDAGLGIDKPKPIEPDKNMCSKCGEYNYDGICSCYDKPKPIVKVALIKTIRNICDKHEDKPKPIEKLPDIDRVQEKRNIIENRILINTLTDAYNKLVARG